MKIVQFQVWTGSEWKADKSQSSEIICIDPDYNNNTKVKDTIKDEQKNKMKIGLTDPGGCCMELRISSNDVGQVAKNYNWYKVVWYPF